MGAWRGGGGKAPAAGLREVTACGSQSAAFKWAVVLLQGDPGMRTDREKVKIAKIVILQG